MGAKIWPVLLLCGLAIPADAQQAPTPVTVGVVKAERSAITRTRRSSGASRRSIASRSGRA